MKQQVLSSTWHVIFGRKERLRTKCSDFDQNQETSRASQKNIVHEVK